MTPMKIASCQVARITLANISTAWFWFGFIHTNSVYLPLFARIKRTKRIIIVAARRRLNNESAFVINRNCIQSRNRNSPLIRGNQRNQSDTFATALLGHSRNFVYLHWYHLSNTNKAADELFDPGNFWTVAGLDAARYSSNHPRHPSSSPVPAYCY